MSSDGVDVVIRHTVCCCLLVLAASAAEVSAADGNTLPAPRFSEDKVLTDGGRTPPGWVGQGRQFQANWRLTRGSADFGIGFGTLAFGWQPGDRMSWPTDHGALNSTSTATVLTMGMHYRAWDNAALYADASGWHGPAVAGGHAFQGKVGLELKSAQSFLNVSYGGLGMRLADDTRLTVRPRHGGLGLFMRTAF